MSKTSDWRPSFSKAPLLVLAGVIGLTAVAAGLVVGDAVGVRRPAGGAEFQRLVRGLGLGGETDLSRCAYAFDPRLARHCSHRCGVLPGGEAFCVSHSFSVFHVARGPVGRAKERDSARGEARTDDAR